MTLIIRSANQSDLPSLTQMNKKLIEDEGSRNPMSMNELQERMRNWILGNWNVDVLQDDDKIIGYAVYQISNDEYFPEKKSVYLRQFFIQSEHRNKGYGSLGIRFLRETRFPKVCAVSIDVLSSNTKGVHFWSKAGFQTYYLNMKL